jgi:hypothetical protein
VHFSITIFALKKSDFFPKEHRLFRVLVKKKLTWQKHFFSSEKNKPNTNKTCSRSHRRQKYRRHRPSLPSRGGEEVWW